MTPTRPTTISPATAPHSTGQAVDEQRAAAADSMPVSAAERGEPPSARTWRPGTVRASSDASRRAPTSAATTTGRPTPHDLGAAEPEDGPADRDQRRAGQVQRQAAIERERAERGDERAEPQAQPMSCAFSDAEREARQRAPSGRRAQVVLASLSSASIRVPVSDSGERRARGW